MPIETILLFLLILLVPEPSLASGPPTCPPGKAPLQRSSGQWQCISGRWMVGTLDPSDCPKGTHLEGIPTSTVCVPPKPKCPQGSSALADPTSASGWDCLQRIGCPAGTKPSLDPSGWNCFPPGNSIRCPKGTVFIGDAAGFCAPADRKTCQATPGWMWSGGGCQRQN